MHLSSYQNKNLAGKMLKHVREKDIAQDFLASKRERECFNRDFLSKDVPRKFWLVRKKEKPLSKKVYPRGALVCNIKDSLTQCNR